MTPLCSASLLWTGLPPVVLFPAFHFTKLLVTVHNQVVAPDCPRSGTFEDWFANDHPSTTFSQVCRDKLLTLRYDADPAKPMPRRFSNQLGVTVQIIDYGMTQSAPFYETLYQTLEAAGYVRNVNIRVAGYDSRLTPDIGDFLFSLTDNPGVEHFSLPSDAGVLARLVSDLRRPRSDCQ